MQTVSIIIPCQNEEKHIEGCLRSLLNNGYPAEFLELLVVDGMSTDKTRTFVHTLSEKYPQIKCIDNERMKTPFALNLGIKHATGYFTLIASAHSSFHPGYIETLVHKMHTLKADVVGGSMETAIKNRTHTSVAIQRVLAHPLGVGNALFRTGVSEDTLVDTVPFGLYKTELLKSVNGYDERLIRNHDIELSKRLIRLNTSIFLTPAASCVYYARETWGALAKNNFNNGKWNLLTVYITKDFSSLSVRHFVPLLFVLSILMPLLGMVFYPSLGLLSALSLTMYSCAVIFGSSKMNRGETTFLHIFITFIVLHFAYGMGSIVGGVQLNKLIKNDLN